MTKRNFTRASLIAAAGATMLLAGPAIAQTAPQPQRDPAMVPNAPAQAPRLKLAPNPLTMEDVTRIKGAIVYGGDDKKIGSVAAVLMRPADKTIDRLVVSEGGVLGIGSHLVVLPLEEFAWDAERAAFRLTATAEEVKGMPEWKEQLTQLPANEPPAPAWPAPATQKPGSIGKPGAPAN